MPLIQLSHILLGAAWLIYLLAGFAGVLRRDRMSLRLFAGGFVAALAAVLLRGAALSRLPMQGMYEFFAAMGVLIYPASHWIAHITRRRQGVIDPLIGVLLLSAPLFVFDPAPLLLPPGLRHWLFGPHVMAYLLGYLIMFRAGCPGLAVFLKADDRRSQELLEVEILALIRLGFPLLTAGLVFGAFWGRLAWGACWNWDPKEMWALATWLAYVAVLPPRSEPRLPAPRRTAALSLLGCVLILCTLLLPNLTRLFTGLHDYSG